MAGMNKRQAAIQAGYAPPTASIVAKTLTDKLSCNRIFLEECERQGLTVHAIVKELKRGVTTAMDPHKPKQPERMGNEIMNSQRILRFKISNNSYKTEKSEKSKNVRILRILTKNIVRILARRRPPRGALHAPRIDGRATDVKGHALYHHEPSTWSPALH